jgi:hypothetical protein
LPVIHHHHLINGSTPSYIKYYKGSLCEAYHPCKGTSYLEGAL